MRVDDTPENAERCACPGCPTYNDCMRSGGQLLFCSRGASDCTPDAVSCKCGGCTVWGRYSLAGYYFCIRGAAT
jgi:aldose sugar dehydrogenase